MTKMNVQTGVENMFGGKSAVQSSIVKDSKPTQETVKETIPVSSDLTITENSKPQPQEPVKVPDHSVLQDTVKTVVEQRVPLSKHVELRHKKQEAEQRAEDYKQEIDALNQEIKEIKKAMSPDQAKSFMSMLDKMDADDSVDVKTVRQMVSTITNDIANTSNQVARQVVEETIRNNELARQKAENEFKVEQKIQKAATDEAEFLEKHKGFDCNRFIKSAKAGGLITDQEIMDIAEQPGNMMEGIYNQVQKNREDRDYLNSIISGKPEQPKQPETNKNMNMMQDERAKDMFDSLPTARKT